MDDRNKILDVTYGSFSCRLEGFDDSVETMKTVVSFFHDLAGHDRFMDVAPQAPDLETLARLTETQSGLSVDIDGQGQNVSLRVRQPEITEERPSLRVHRPVVADKHAMEEDDFDLAAEDDDFDNDDADDADHNVTQSAPEPEPEPESEPLDLEASVAEKLNRIRAVVGRGHMPPKNDAYAEDLTEREERSGAANPLAQRLAELAKRNSELRDVDDAAEDSQQDSELTEQDQFKSDVSESALAEAATVEDADDFDYDEDDDALAAASSDLTPDEAEEPETSAPSDARDAAPAPLGPLVLTSRDAAIDDIDDNLDDDPLEDDTFDDDDFDLHEEVAKVEAEIASRRGNEVARHGLPRSVDDAMSRILSQTDQHLNEPESRRHRDAFAQLKAAVAATEAARQLGDTGGKTRDTEEDFKDDLGAHDAQERAQAQSLPTLKLVKNDPDPDVATPQDPQSRPLDAASERLRHIAAQKEQETPVTAGGFAEFAAEQGAKELIDLLEAAAAYISFVEGDSDFSRPQVMRKVQSATNEEISREDGLRSFGRLLRQSKIIKLNNGRFQVAENSRFRPDDGQAARG